MQSDRNAARQRHQRLDLLANRLGATIMTEVALTRPRTIKSRIAAVYAGRKAVIIGTDPNPPIPAGAGHVASRSCGVATQPSFRCRLFGRGRRARGLARSLSRMQCSATK